MDETTNGKVISTLSPKEIIEAAKKEKQERALRFQNRLQELLKEENCRLNIVGSFNGNYIQSSIQVIAD